MTKQKKELASVSKKVRKYRKERCLSQDRLAKKADDLEVSVDDLLKE